MNESIKIPNKLKVVSCVFLLLGIFAFIELLNSLKDGNIYIDAQLLGIFIFWGLLKRVNGWRIVALILISLFLFFTPIGMLFYFFFNDPEGFDFFSLTIGNYHKVFGALIFLSVFFINFWMHKVLHHPDVANLFYKKLSN